MNTPLYQTTDGQMSQQVDDIQLMPLTSDIHRYFAKMSEDRNRSMQTTPSHDGGVISPKGGRGVSQASATGFSSAAAFSRRSSSGSLPRGVTGGSMMPSNLTAHSNSMLRNGAQHTSFSYQPPQSGVGVGGGGTTVSLSGRLQSTTSEMGGGGRSNTTSIPQGFGQGSNYYSSSAAAAVAPSNRMMSGSGGGGMRDLTIGKISRSVSEATNSNQLSNVTNPGLSRVQTAFNSAAMARHSQHDNEEGDYQPPVDSFVRRHPSASALLGDGGSAMHQAESSPREFSPQYAQQYPSRPSGMTVMQQQQPEASQGAPPTVFGGTSPVPAKPRISLSDGRYAGVNLNSGGVGSSGRSTSSTNARATLTPSGTNINLNPHSQMILNEGIGGSSTHPRVPLSTSSSRPRSLSGVATAPSVGAGYPLHRQLSSTPQRQAAPFPPFSSPRPRGEQSPGGNYGSSTGPSSDGVGGGFRESSYLRQKGMERSMVPIETKGGRISFVPYSQEVYEQHQQENNIQGEPPVEPVLPVDYPMPQRSMMQFDSEGYDAALVARSQSQIRHQQQHELAMPLSSSQRSERSMAGSSLMAQQQGGGFPPSEAGQRGRVVNYAQHDSRNTLHDICTHLAGIRQVPAPVIPEQVYYAWDNYVGPGAFFIKYPNSGSCHERFFELKMLDSDAGTREPYLVWFKHEKATTRQGMMHLLSLQGTDTGVGYEAFQRFLIPRSHPSQPQMAHGPIVDGSRVKLPTDLAMSVSFLIPSTASNNKQTVMAKQAVSMLGTIEAVYQGWRLVLDFLGGINTIRHTDDNEDDGWVDAGENLEPGEEDEQEQNDHHQRQTALPSTAPRAQPAAAAPGPPPLYATQSAPAYHSPERESTNNNKKKKPLFADGVGRAQGGAAAAGGPAQISVAASSGGSVVPVPRMPALENPLVDHPPAADDPQEGEVEDEGGPEEADDTTNIPLSEQ